MTLDGAPTFLSLFAGIGGVDLGLTGFRCVGQVELDPFCRRVLAKRYPLVRRWRDVRRFRGTQAGRTGRVDLLTGGFPCQDLSVAGKRAGLGGSRSGLFWEIVRIQKIVRAPWGFFENVPGLLSSNHGRDMWAVLRGLRECWPAVGYCVFDSRFFGVAQRRRRVFFVCGPDEARVAEVLFEPEGGSGHPAPGREAGARIARSLAVGAVGSGYRYDPNGEEYVIADTLNSGGSAGGFRTEPGAHLVATALQARDAKGQDSDCTKTLIFQVHGSNVGPMGALRKGDGGLTSGVPFVAHALSAEGADASEDGTGRGTPIVALQEPTLAARKGGHGLGVDESGLMYTLEAAAPHAVAFTERTRKAGRTLETQEDLAYALTNPGSGGRTHSRQLLDAQMTVRRLTPTEAARLQGFPDGWCCLCQSLEAWAADPEAAAERCTCSDSPQYRAYGNAVTVNVIEWIGRRLRKAIA